MERKKRKCFKFSSLFPCDSQAVDDRFAYACCIFNIMELRKFPEVKDTYHSLLQTAGSAPRLKGPEGSVLVDVPGDGNCLYYTLVAPLLGYIPDKNVVQKVRNILVDKVLADKSLQRNFDFSHEKIWYKGESIRVKNINDWADLARKDGAWGDSSVI